MPTAEIIENVAEIAKSVKSVADFANPSNLIETAIDATVAVTKDLAGVVLGTDAEDNRAVTARPPRGTQQFVQKEQVTTFHDDNLISSFQMAGDLSQVSNSLTKTEISNLSSLLSRPQIVAVGNVSSNDEPLPLNPPNQQNIDDSSFFHLDFPDSLFRLPLIESKLAYFSFFKASVCIKLVVNAPPFVQGKLIMVSRPWFRGTNLDTSRNSAAGLTGFPHVEVDLSSGNSGQMKMPFCAPFHAWDLVNFVNTDSTSFTTFGYVLNMVNSATLPESIPFTVYAWFEDVELTVPTPQRISIVPPNLVVTSSSAFRERMPQAQVLDDGSTSSHTIFANLPGAGYNNALGAEQGVSLSLSPNELVPRHDVATTQDEMSLDYVCKRECLLTRFPFTDADAAYEELFRMPVAPNVSQHFVEDSTGFDIFFPSVLAFTSSMFAYWRGTMRYRLSVAKTAYHSGRLRLSFVPVVRSSYLLTGNELSNAYSIIWDLRESSDLTFDVPFVFPLDMAPIAGLVPIDSVNPSLATGYLSVSVLNPLRNTATVASDVSINLWVSSPDMQFAVSSRIPGIRPYLRGVPPTMAEFTVNFPASYDYVSNAPFEFYCRVPDNINPIARPGSYYIRFLTPITFTAVNSNGEEFPQLVEFTTIWKYDDETYFLYFPYDPSFTGAFDPIATQTTNRFLNPAPADYSISPIRPDATLDAKMAKVAHRVKRMAEAQVLGDVAEANKSTEANQAVLLMPMLDSPCRPLVTSELITSFRDIIHRHTLSSEFVGTQVIYPNFFKTMGLGNAFVRLSLLEYISQIYVLNYGSQSYKIFSTNNTPLLATLDITSTVTASPAAGSIKLGSDMGTTVRGDINNFLEFRVPHFSNAVHKVNSQKITNDMFAPEVTITGGSDINYLLRAGGADFSFGFLVGAPAVTKINTDLPEVISHFGETQFTSYEAGDSRLFITFPLSVLLPPGTYTLIFDSPIEFDFVTDGGSNPITRGRLVGTVLQVSPPTLEIQCTTIIEAGEIVNPGNFLEPPTTASIVALGDVVTNYIPR